jgi:hypothetical protein
MAAAKYDPGKPTPVFMIEDGKFFVPSFRGKDKAYVVTLGAHPSCTCPAFSRPRIGQLWHTPCKHIEAARTQEAFVVAQAKAKRLSDAEIDRLLTKYASDPLISGVLRVEREERRQAKASEPKAWKSIKVFGPTSDEEMREALR